MQYSAEVRWFAHGPLPDGIQDWFQCGYNLDPQGVWSERNRMDRYLIFPNCDSVGVKLRADRPDSVRLEIKSIIGTPRPIASAAGVNGRTDEWVKWSVAISDLPQLPGILTGSGKWTAVAKDRFLRKYSTDQGAPVEVSPRAESLPGQGCNVELTRIKVDASPADWFSLGFEAFGPVAQGPGILEQTIEAFFRQQGRMPEMELAGRESLSYPAWLATLG